MPPRLAAALLFAGGLILVYRALALILGGATARFVPWLAALTHVELTLATAAVLAALAWLAKPSPGRARLTLRLTAALILLHAVRVGVFVTARVGPWRDYDIRPEARAGHAETWTWPEVWLAGGLTVASLFALVLVWRHRRGRR